MVIGDICIVSLGDYFVSEGQITLSSTATFGQVVDGRTVSLYVGVLISLWLFLFPIFLFAAQPKEFLLDGLKKSEQRSHKCVELRGEYVE
jgi:hypothetical protein